MNFKDYDEQRDFEIWAFGSSPIIYSAPTMHTWNSIHGKELWLTEDGNMVEDIKKMFALYQEYVREKYLALKET